MKAATAYVRVSWSVSLGERVCISETERGRERDLECLGIDGAPIDRRIGLSTPPPLPRASQHHFRCQLPSPPFVWGANNDPQGTNLDVRTRNGSSQGHVWAWAGLCVSVCSATSSTRWPARRSTMSAASSPRLLLCGVPITSFKRTTRMILESFMNVYIHILTDTYIYIYMHMYVYMYMCVYI